MTSKYTINTISFSDGSWQAFEADWQLQCSDMGESFNDYAPDSLGVLKSIADGTLKTADGPGSKTVVAALIERSSGQHHLACMLNLANIPGTDGMTLRVRHLLVSPRLDYGSEGVAAYADVLVGTLAGVVKVSESDMSANNIRFHLRSPGDAEFFAAFGKALDGEQIFRSVEMRGSWLYITKL